MSSSSESSSSASPLAIVALICGIASLFLFFFVFGLLGAAAVALGLLALKQIREAKVAKGGRGLARAGVVTGSIGLLLGIALTVLVQYQNGATLVETRLDDAEKVLLSQTGVETGFGNAEASVALANQMATRMEKFCTDSLTEKPGGFSIVGDRHVAYCQMGRKSAAFLIVIPRFRKYSAESQIQIGKEAWQAAQQIVDGKLPAGSELAVALRSGLAYDLILSGKMGGKSERGNVKNLERYFVMK